MKVKDILEKLKDISPEMEVTTMARKRLLVGCECSGIVRDAFRRIGWEAWSCDFLESETPGPHIVGDVLNHLHDGWDMAIFHPDCTFLCSSGLHWNNKVEGRNKKTEEAIAFVKALMEAPIPKICIENPVGRIGTAIRPADQYIQPYQFGHDASKKTGLWLKNLLPLAWTKWISPRIVNGKERWANQTDSGQNRIPPSEHRWMDRARTYEGIAEAMADQWGEINDGSLEAVE